MILLFGSNSGIVGTINRTEEDDISAMSGESINVGSMSVTEEDDGGAFVGALDIDIMGAISVTEEDDTSAIQGHTPIYGTILVAEEADFVDANEKFYGTVKNPYVEQMLESNRQSRLQIPQPPRDIPPVARQYLDTTFRYIEDEFNRLSNFQFKAINLAAAAVQDLQDDIANLIPLIPVNPNVPPPTIPPWTPFPTNPTPTDDGVLITIPAPGPGCEMYWELKRRSLANMTWTTTLTGTSLTGQLLIPDAYFDDGYTYKVCWQEVCPDSIDDMTCGDPFANPLDTSCVTPAQVADLPWTDGNLQYFAPQVCPPSLIEEAVSLAPASFGAAFGGMLINPGNRHYVLSNDVNTGIVVNGTAPNMVGHTGSGQIAMTIRPRVWGPALLRVGSMQLGLMASAPGFLLPYARAILADGTPVQAQGGTSLPIDVTYDLTATVDRQNGLLSVFVDGAAVDTESFTPQDLYANDGVWILHMSSNSYATELAAFDDLVSPVAEVYMNSGDWPGSAYNSLRLAIDVAREQLIIGRRSGATTGVMELWDISDPANPVFLDDVAASSNDGVHSLKYNPSNSRVYASSSVADVPQTYAIGAGSISAALTGTYVRELSGFRAIYLGTGATVIYPSYVTDGINSSQGGIEIYNSSLVHQGTYQPTGYSATETTIQKISDTRLLVWHTTRLTVLDISTPTSPSIVWNTVYPGVATTNHIGVTSTHLFVPKTNGDLYVLDATNGAILATVASGFAGAFSATVDGNIIALTDGSFVSIGNIATPTAPVLPSPTALSTSVGTSDMEMALSATLGVLCLSGIDTYAASNTTKLAICAF